MILYSIIFFNIFCLSYSYKILVFCPRSSHSHVNFLGSIADILVKGGHDVTYLLAEANPQVTTNGSKLAKLHIVPNTKEIAEKYLNMSSFTDVWLTSKHPTSHMKLAQKRMTLIKDQCSHLTNNLTLTEYMKNQKFDIGITEYFYSCGIGLFKMYNIPIFMNAAATVLPDSAYDFYGLEFPSSYVPAMMIANTDKMTYFRRMLNLFSFLFSKFFMKYALVNYVQDVYDVKFGPGYLDIMNDITLDSYALINTHPLLEFNFPQTNKILQIGGMKEFNINKLNDEFNKILNIRKKNVLISFGSHAQSSKMPLKMKKTIVNLIKDYPNITFIWKYETNETDFLDGLKNVYLFKWIPQIDLLSDGRISLFITHAGLNSVLELTYFGVPSLLVPLFGDQMRNSKMISRHGVGVAVTKELLYDSEKFKESFKEVLENGNYLKNGKKLSQMLKNYPVNQTDTIIRHTEKAVRWGKVNILNLQSRKKSFYQYYFMDNIVYLFIFVFIIYFL
ncbi:UDP-glucuronosyl/UDP-glucosyltransferase family-containing protein [Strongyloides ratti]|uniref:glucuronosyltransferase n=1 Tax=Strongyloides ratti TaxID=34506 RepID=A0A090N0V0_STRRB|nr:UDP-glucuronosyl/UDP-glucosyltransferase family-containing protein [Strongyloides ratti]CEF71323.1 UDP-glucuronosyl/UDP-glucosyltransferase family-containing protein [Strongyloides ratti]